MFVNLLNVWFELLVMFLYVLYLKWQVLPFETKEVCALPFAWPRRYHF